MPDGRLHELARLPGCTVQLVDAQQVKRDYWVDFTEGGHALQYPWIPHDEIWVADNLNNYDRDCTILHEWVERALMSKGWQYEQAHQVAAGIEKQYRLQPGRQDVVQLIEWLSS